MRNIYCMLGQGSSNQDYRRWWDQQGTMEEEEEEDEEEKTEEKGGWERWKRGPRGDIDADDEKQQLINLGTEPSDPLAYDMGSGHHHNTMRTLGGNVGRLDKERERQEQVDWRRPLCLSVE